MPPNLDKVKFLIGNADNVSRMTTNTSFVPFDERIIEFLDHISKDLMKNPKIKAFPDIATFAFWCRKASIIELSKAYANLNDRLGRGIVFHIAPSNVPINFAYSLVVGLISGNSNIVRISSKDFPQTEIIVDSILHVNDEIAKNTICIVQYEHDIEVTNYFSSICDSRIIWGGDETISNIRKSPLKARAIDITFADRHSLLLIDADQYLKEEKKSSIAQGFYNDTYLTDQNACTSPKVVVWFGNEINQAQSSFWEELYKIVSLKYELNAVYGVNKYLNFCKQAAMNEQVELINFKDNFIYRVNVGSITSEIRNHFGNCGYFIEYNAKKIEEILPILSSQCQTITYHGIEKSSIKNFIITCKPSGVDRVVPIGKSMDFSLIWDGYDLITQLTRVINFK